MVKNWWGDWRQKPIYLLGNPFTFYFLPWHLRSKLWNDFVSEGFASSINLKGLKQIQLWAILLFFSPFDTCAAQSGTWLEENPLGFTLLYVLMTLHSNAVERSSTLYLDWLAIFDPFPRIEMSRLFPFTKWHCNLETTYPLTVRLENDGDESEILYCRILTGMVCD